MTAVEQRLRRTGHNLSRWQAELQAALWAAGVLAVLWLSSVFDVFVQFERLSRFVAWSAIVGLVIFAAWRINGLLRRKRTVQGIAATVEKAFPELDNHLINYIQFLAQPERDAFREAYVRRGVPEFGGIPLKQMKHWKAHVRAYAALGAVVLLLGLTALLAGRAWAVSLWRVVNPFSDCPPVSLTRIVDVSPGDISITRGADLTVRCTVSGKRGHRVALDIQPSDDNRKTIALGSVSGRGSETFEHTIAKVTTDLKYRFRAGDAPFPSWYTVTAKPPLAFTGMDLVVTPPSYTRYRSRSFDALTDDVEIPEGSTVQFVIRANRPLHSAAVSVNEKTRIPMTSQEKGAWSAAVTVTNEAPITLSANGSDDETTSLTLRHKLIPDRPPEIRILSPHARTLLSADSVPAVGFEVEDDHGLSQISIERVPPGSTQDATGDVREEWAVGGEKRHSGQWIGTGEEIRQGQTVAYRVVARDICPFGARKAVSEEVLFDTVAPDALQEKVADAEQNVEAAIEQILHLQRENLQQTMQYQGDLASADAAAWKTLENRQATIRQLTGKLLRNPIVPFGAETPAVKDLYLNEMTEAISNLGLIPQSQGARQYQLVKGTVTIEETILRRLSGAGVVAGSTLTRRKISGLLSQLTSLIERQSNVLDDTKEYVRTAARVGRALVSNQDDLAEDTAAFVGSCRAEAPSLSTVDKAFSELILQVAKQCEEQEVRPDMLRAAESLEKNAPREAVPNQEQAIAKLEKLREMLNRWKIAHAEERLDETLDALRDAREKLSRLSEVESKVVDAMKQIESQEDLSGEERDLMEEELDAVHKNMKDALLQIPRDLHVFPELSVANELVEDVYSIFEEVDTSPEEDQEGPRRPEDVRDTPWLKPEALLDAMKEADGRLADMEMWLPEHEDIAKETTESFDREEMSKMALGALETSAPDLIGDLLEESKEIQDAADDSAINHSVSDLNAGWLVSEGGATSQAAKGRSGNRTPDHSEQSSRSNIGRQGMASGEAAAGSGTIGKGDQNIENRLTKDPLQSGQVQVDGEGEARATGGGKQASGAAEESGMTGAGSDRRMDATSMGSLAGLEALMAKTQALYVKGSLLNLRTESLGAAAHYIRQANDAIAEGLPISQVREHQRRAVAALQRAQTELRAGTSAGLTESDEASPLRDAMEGSKDDAPVSYQPLVAEYFKALNKSI